MPDSIEAFTAAFEKAHKVAKAFGDSTDSLLPVSNSELLIHYRGRLASKYQRYSKQFKDADLSRILDAAAMTGVEDSIFADAMRAVNDPANYKPGELRALHTRDPSGREITKYVGHEGACWAQFAPPIRHVRRILTPGTAPA